MNNRKILASTVIALAAMAAGSAFADSYDREQASIAPTQSTLTRAQVQAELAQARQDGSLPSMNNYYDYPVIANVGTAKTRAQVRAELVQAQKDGSLPVFFGG